MQKNSNKVYITGMGALCSIGRDINAINKSLQNSLSGIKKGQWFSLDDEQLAAMVDKSWFCDIKADAIIKRMALIPFKEALGQALLADRNDLAQTSLIMGVSVGGMPETETDFINKKPFNFKKAFTRHPASSLQIFLQKTFRLASGLTFVSACTSSAHAIVYAYQLVASGICERVIAGGADTLSYMTYYGFNALSAMTHSGCKPFAKDRDGMVLGEGAAFIVLENMESACRRNAEPLLEILGTGQSSDAHHITGPHPKGDGAYQAMTLAIRDACINRSDIGYINAHGTGTMANDFSEAIAIERVFNGACPPVSSTKAHTGHILGGCGALETIISGLTIKNGFIPQTLNTIELAPEMNLNLILAKPLKSNISRAMTNSFAFGGNNVSIILGGIDA